MSAAFTVAERCTGEPIDKLLGAGIERICQPHVGRRDEEVNDGRARVLTVDHGRENDIFGRPRRSAPIHRDGDDLISRARVGRRDLPFRHGVGDVEVTRPILRRFRPGIAELSEVEGAVVEIGCGDELVVELAYLLDLVLGQIEGETLRAVCRPLLSFWDAWTKTGTIAANAMPTITIVTSNSTKLKPASRLQARQKCLLIGTLPPDRRVVL